MALIDALSTVHFLRPVWLLGLPVAGLVLFWLAFRRDGRSGRNAGTSLIDAHLEQRLLLHDEAGEAQANEKTGRSRRWMLVLPGLGWIAAVIALAGPSFEKLPVEGYVAPQNRIVLLDLSSSMNEVDLAPSRIERVLFKLADLLDLAEQQDAEQRVALLAFAQSVHVVTPLTDDLDTLRNLLSGLSPTIMPVDGNRLAPALQEARNMVVNNRLRDAELLLISDGIDDPAAAIAALAELNSAAASARLSVYSVLPRPDPILAELANRGAGSIVSLRADDADLRLLLSADSGRGFAAQREQSDIEFDEWDEAGVMLLVPLALLAAFAARRGWLLALVLTVGLLPHSERAIADTPSQPGVFDRLLLTPDQRAAQQFAAGRPEQAAEQFEDPKWRATAAYRAGDYVKAAELFAGFDDAESLYNRGNALAHTGQVDAALEAYNQALEKAPGHQDAKANRDLLNDVLERLKNQAANQDPKQQNEQRNGQQSEPKAGSGHQDPQQSAESDKNSDDGQADKSSDPSGVDSAEPDSQAAESQQGQAQADASPSEKGAEKGAEKTAAKGSPSAQREDEGELGDLARREAEQASQQQANERAEAPNVAPGDESDDARGDQAGTAPPAADPDVTPTPANANANGDEEETVKNLTEEDLAVQALLDQLRDDPSGMLRRKFMRQHLRRQNQGEWPGQPSGGRR